MIITSLLLMNFASLDPAVSLIPKYEAIATTAFQTYPEVTIGRQVWMGKNLDVDKFSNGDPIQMVSSAEQFQNAEKNRQPAWCYPDFNPANGEKYGKLYNWYAVNDERGLAPQGWYVPIDKDWGELISVVGATPGAKLKTSTGWYSGDRSTNQSGFGALPAGLSNYKPAYFGKMGYWWTRTERDRDMAWVYVLVSSLDGYKRETYSKANFYSVRCLRIP